MADTPFIKEAMRLADESEAGRVDMINGGITSLAYSGRDRHHKARAALLTHLRTQEQADAILRELLAAHEAFPATWSDAWQAAWSRARDYVKANPLDGVPESKGGQHG
jgi:hypothetical protein